MAEFCVGCWNKIMETNEPRRKFVLSLGLELCEECGEWKHVIVKVKKHYILKEALEEFLSSRKKD